MILSIFISTLISVVVWMIWDDLHKIEKKKYEVLLPVFFLVVVVTSLLSYVMS